MKRKSSLILRGFIVLVQRESVRGCWVLSLRVFEFLSCTEWIFLERIVFCCLRDWSFLFFA